MDASQSRIKYFFVHITGGKGNWNLRCNAVDFGLESDMVYSLSRLLSDRESDVYAEGIGPCQVITQINIRETVIYRIFGGNFRAVGATLRPVDGQVTRFKALRSP